MKQIKVNQKCSGCGLCIMNSSYLEEDLEGNAVPVPGLAIKEGDLEAVKKLVSECPEKALQIKETGVAAKPGIAGIQDIIADLNKKCNQLSVKQITSSDVRFNVKDYPLAIPHSNKEYCREYTSESSARSAAKEEFNRLCYSESAYRPLLKKVFVEYKVHVLKPFYICQDVPDSFYYEYNEKIRAYLNDAYAEICGLIGNDRIPESWKNFSLYLSEKEWSIEALRNFDDRSDKSGIFTYLKSLPHSSFNDYVEYILYDYDKRYVGEGLFGKSKYIKMWYFYGLNDRINEFIQHLTWAFNYRADEIEEAATNFINSALKSFEEMLKKEFNLKILKLQELVK